MGKRIEPTHPVTVGSYWQDARYPGDGRVVKVMAVDETHATIMTLVNNTLLQLEHDRRGNFGGLRDMRGTTRRVRLDRFRDMADGFVFVPDGPAEVARRDRELAAERERLDRIIDAFEPTADAPVGPPPSPSVDPRRWQAFSEDSMEVFFDDISSEEDIFL